MRHFNVCSAIVAGLIALGSDLGAGSSAAYAQPAGLNPSRDCQVIRTCNFTSNGSYRGCLSSYTCRTCRLVPARCTLAGRSVCREFVCSWGG